MAISALQAAASMGIVSQTVACVGSANAQAPNPPSTGPNNPTNNGPSPRPIDWPNEVGNGKSVIVLGVGIAGMTAGFELRKLGYQVTILEANDKPGGRCRTIRSGDTVTEIDSEQICTFDNEADLYFNPGPARIPHHHDLILGYCRQFNVPLEPFVNDNQAALFHNPSAYQGTPQIARRVIAETRGYIADLLAEAIQQGNVSANLSVSEQANFLSLLQQYGELDGNLNFSATSRAGFPGQEVADSRMRDQQTSIRSLNQLLASNFWQFQLDFAQAIDQQATMLQPVGGMDKIALEFAEQFNQELIFEATVTEINNSQSGVEVTYENKVNELLTLSADYCITTIPATVLRGISNNFASEYTSAIANFNYSQSVKVAFQSERFWETQQSIYGGISWTSQPITQLWYPSHGFGSDQGILVGAYTFGSAAGQQLSNLLPAARAQTVIAQANALHEQITSSASRELSVAWPKVPNQLGVWGVSEPGVLTSPDESVYFAGEHLSILQGWQEGAILSAYHSIDQIVQRDLAG